MNRPPRISVVVATYNRAETLRTTLRHLAEQDVDGSEFEVIVVDDGSPDHTGDVAREFAAQGHVECRYLSHENRGPGYTQNRGIRDARAPLVLLIADDIYLSPHALRAHLAIHAANPGREVAALGKVLQWREPGQSPFLKAWDPFRFSALEGMTELPTYRFWACNLSVKREFLLKNGMFREERARAGAASHEDVELGYRLSDHGLRLLYAPEALGHHDHPATLETAVMRWYERGINYSDFRRLTPHPELTVHLHVLTWQTLPEYVRVLRGPNPFEGAEKSLPWHLVRHLAQVVLLNRLSVRWIWKPVLEAAERHPSLGRWMRPQIYRAYLYYHFMRGVHDAAEVDGSASRHEQSA